MAGKVGLVLEGGAMRGMFTAGVLDVFLDENIQIDGIVSVSAGALFGANFPAKQYGRALRYNLRFLNDKRYIGLRNWLKEGNVVSRDFAFYEMPQQLDVFDNEAFKQSGIPFYAVVTNVETGLAEYHQIHDVFAQMETLRATSAMPYFSKMVEINGKPYLDGALADSIPLNFCRQLGFDKIIVVLTRHLDYRKPPATAWLNKLVYGKYPRLVETMNTRHLHYNQMVEEVEQAAKNGEIFAIRPSQDLAIKRLESDPNKIQAMYDLGVSNAKEQLEKLKAYLSG